MTQQNGYRRDDNHFFAYDAIRAYEPRADGQIDMGGLARYFELAANLASAASGFSPQWYRDRGEGWVIRDQSIDLFGSARSGEPVRMETWVKSYSRVSAVRDYMLSSEVDGHIIGAGSATWAYIQRDGQVLQRIPEALARAIPSASGSATAPARKMRRLTDDVPIGEPLVFAARRYEADQMRHINNCVYVDWMCEAAEQQRAAIPALRAARMTRFEISYLRSAKPGDLVAVTVYLQENTADAASVYIEAQDQTAGEKFAAALAFYRR